MVNCRYCLKPAKLVDSAVVYGGRSFGNIWLCEPCDAYVGVHKNSKEQLPLGRLANSELRGWRKKAHAVFDPMWKRKMEKEKCSQRQARTAGYKWLADQLDIRFKDCHIAEFEVDECKCVVAVCEPFASR